MNAPFNRELMGSAPIEYSGAVAMATAYTDAIAEIRQAFELLGSAERRLSEAFERRYGFNVIDRHDTVGGVRDGAVDTIERRLRSSAWRAIVEKLAIRPLLSAERWRALEDQIAKGSDLPEISPESIEDQAREWVGNLSEYFSEAAAEVLDYLRPRPHWRRPYKTNDRVAVGPKVIVRVYYPAQYDRRDWWRSAPNFPQGLIATDNVFHMLDGRKRKGSFYGPLIDAIIASDGAGETDLFRFKVFANGNLHLSFKRLDLLGDLHRIAGWRIVSDADADSSHTENVASSAQSPLPGADDAPPDTPPVPGSLLTSAGHLLSPAAIPALDVACGRRREPEEALHDFES